MNHCSFPFKWTQTQTTFIHFHTRPEFRLRKLNFRTISSYDFKTIPTYCEIWKLILLNLSVTYPASYACFSDAVRLLCSSPDIWRCTCAVKRSGTNPVKLRFDKTAQTSIKGAGLHQQMCFTSLLLHSITISGRFRAVFSVGGCYFPT